MLTTGKVVRQSSVPEEEALKGADIENLVNIAALKASQEGRTSLEKGDFEKGYRDMMNSKRDIQASSQDQVKEFLPQQVKTKSFNRERKYTHQGLISAKSPNKRSSEY